jgi:predicted RNase H-like HicB family nuclease
VLEPDPNEGGFTVLVPALPGCVTQGETVDECIERAKEAIAGYLECLAKDGLPAPDDVRTATVSVAA